MTVSFSRLTRCTLALAGAVVLALPAAAATEALPPVIQTLQKQGLSEVHEFKVGAGLRGFAGFAADQPVAIYVTSDGDAIVGSRVNAEGDSVDSKTLDELVAKPMSTKVWKQLDQAAWFRDGSADAPRVIYAFMDANCPYCHQFYEAARPWVKAGKVQLRHIMVGVIRADSKPKAAAILSAADPAAAMAQNEKTFGDGGIRPAPNVPKEVGQKIDANQDLMVELGFRGTPGILYQDKDGLVQRIGGLPPQDELAKVLGPL